VIPFRSGTDEPESFAAIVPSYSDRSLSSTHVSFVERSHPQPVDGIGWINNKAPVLENIRAACQIPALRVDWVNLKAFH